MSFQYLSEDQRARYRRFLTDPSPEDLERLSTQHEHAREIRGLLGYREFANAEAEVRAFVASRAAQTRDSRRELFDRAVLWLIGGRVLLPGITTLAPLVTSVRAEQLAAMRHLEGVSVDDALLLFDLLMATKLLARANRDEKNEKLKSLPRLRKAALQAESALRAALDTPMTQPGQPAGGEAGPAGAGPVMRVTTAPEMIARIALVVPIEQLEAALSVIREFLPAEQDDADLAWRAELTSRFASVRGFVELLAETVPWGGTDAGIPVIAALRALPRVLAYGKHAGARHIEAHKDLVSGSWRRLVYGSPGPGDGQIDRHAYTFCVLEALRSPISTCTASSQRFR